MRKIRKDKAQAVEIDSWQQLTSDIAEAIGDSGDADVWGLACGFVDRAKDIARLAVKISGAKHRRLSGE